MKGSKGGFTVHDQEQIYQNNRVHIFSDLEFGIDAQTRGLLVFISANRI